ncbi:HlyC/CorC family transporter [Deinococcus sp. KSM4-11]|uniref:hemolysin family protein n=1 Tax=Deinococcus sp. KSM4-11 TaxID=2568654 RepID=UPI0010A3B94C|nr:hemolysin family protein [Deinococcus sp. KSM4-11]THF85046.1 HlyC/CorC family transporter [Deinococcus sp. KSM4-11]
MGNPLLEFGILVLLLILNGFFSASELGVVSARRSRLEAAAQRGERGAGAAAALGREPGAFLATVQIGITLIGTVSAVFAGGTLTSYMEGLLRPVLGDSAGAAASVAVVLLVTFLSLVLGELAPKNIALRNPEALAARVAPFFAGLSRVARPVVWLLDVTTRGLLALLGIRGQPPEVITEDDVRAVVSQAAQSGSLEHTEQARISSVLRFNDRRVRDLMTPRGQAVTLSLTSGTPEVAAQVLAAGHDTYPVRDHAGEISGLLTVLDVLRAVQGQQELAALVRPALYLPEGAWAEDALTRLERGGTRLAVVVDEYGAFSGLISLTDLLSEFSGTDTALPDDGRLVRREDGSYLADGALPIHDLRGVLPLPALPREDFSTLAGYVLAVLGDFPQVGTVLDIEGWTLEVMDMDGPRIDRLLLRPPASPQAPATESRTPTGA